MFCNNCGKQNDDNSKFCVNCGQSLSPSPPAFFQSGGNRPHPEQHLFETLPELKGTEKTDTGYFLITLLTMLNVAMWFIWSKSTANSITGHESFYKIIRILTVLFLMGQFIISFLFTKKEVYKIIIVIVGLACTAYYFYYLIEDLKRF
jgi:zinc-ribbon domain